MTQSSHGLGGPARCSQHEKAFHTRGAACDVSAKRSSQMGFKPRLSSSRHWEGVPSATTDVLQHPGAYILSPAGGPQAAACRKSCFSSGGLLFRFCAANVDLKRGDCPLFLRNAVHLGLCPNTSGLPASLRHDLGAQKCSMPMLPCFDCWLAALSDVCTRTPCF